MIIHKEQNYIICKKPVGISSQKTDGKYDMPTIIAEKINVSVDSIFPVHRLDNTVGGTMVYALTKRGAAYLSKIVSEGNMKKTYLAIVHGKPEDEKGILRDLLFKDSSKNKSYVVKRLRKGVKEASLEYELIDTTCFEGKEMSLVKILLHTGRTHQIRVQFSHRKMPLVGDRRYGSGKDNCPVALWSHSIDFECPFDNTKRQYTSMPDATQFPWNLFVSSYFK